MIILKVRTRIQILISSHIKMYDITKQCLLYENLHESLFAFSVRQYSTEDCIFALSFGSICSSIVFVKTVIFATTASTFFSVGA